MSDGHDSPADIDMDSHHHESGQVSQAVDTNAPAVSVPELDPESAPVPFELDEFQVPDLVSGQQPALEQEQLLEPKQEQEPQESLDPEFAPTATESAPIAPSEPTAPTAPPALEPEPQPQLQSQKPPSNPPLSVLQEKDPSLSAMATPEFVAAFLSVDVSSTTGLARIVLQQIAHKAHELEQLKGEKTLDQVAFEQRLHEASSSLDAAESDRDRAKQEATELAQARNQLQDEAQRLRTELASAQAAAQDLRDQRAVVDTRVQALVAERRYATEALDRRSAEYRQLRDEYDAVQKRQLEARRRILELETELTQTRMDARTAQLKLEHSDREIASLKQSNQWLDKQLAEKTEQHKTARGERARQVSELTVQLDTLKADHGALIQGHAALQVKHAELLKSHDAALVRVADLRSHQGVSEEGFKNEMAAQRRLTELWEKSANDNKKRVAELDAALEQERARAAQSEQELTQEVARLRTESSRLRRSLSQVEGGLVDEVEAADAASADVSVSLTPRTPLSKTLAQDTPRTSFSPSAQIIADIQRGGGSLVQLYSDYQEMKTRYQRERHKNAALRAEMDTIVAEMEANAPAMLAERDETRRMEADLADLSVQLESYSRDVESYKARLAEAQLKATDGERENGLLHQQNIDLARQVRHLLVQVQLLTSDEPPLSDTEQAALDKMVQGDLSDTGRLISERLVLFTSVVEAQQQNEQLLKITRELAQRLEADEQANRAKLADVESAAVAESREAIIGLQQQLDQLTQRYEALQRERDMFRRMFSNKTNIESDAPLEGESDAYSQLLRQNKVLTETLAQTKQELEDAQQRASQTVSSLQNQLAEVDSVRSELQITVSKLESQLELSRERFAMLEHNDQLLRTDNVELKRQASELQQLLARQDARAQQVVAELAEVRGSSDTLKSEASNLKAERALHESIEQRLTAENHELLEERGRLNGVIATLQSAEAEREVAVTEARRRDYAQIEQLEAQAVELRARADRAADEVRALALRKEQDASQYQNRLDRLQTDLGARGEQLNQLQGERDKLRQKVAELERQLTTLQDRVNIYQGSGGSEVDSNSSLRMQLESLSVELQTSQANLADMTRMARAAEESLTNLSDTYDQYKASVESKLTEKDEALATLQAALTQAKLTSDEAETKIAGLQAESDAKFRVVEGKRLELEIRVKDLTLSEENLKEVERSLRAQLAAQTEQAAEAHSNYTAELEARKALATQAQDLHAQVNDLTQQVLDLRAKATSAVDSLEASRNSWTSQAYLYDQEVAQLKARVEDLTAQNNMLVEQVAARGVVDTGADGSDEAETSESVTAGSVVRMLKREKDIAQTAAEAATAEAHRLQQQLGYANAELEQLRADRDTIKVDTSSTAATADLARLQSDNSILRESNTHLRTRCETFQTKCKDQAAQLQELSAKLEVVEGQLRDAKVQIESLSQAGRLMEEDGLRWKERALKAEGSINATGTEKDVAKTLDKSVPNSVDELKAQLAEVKAEAKVRFDNLQAEAMNKLSKRREEAADLKRQLAVAVQQNEEKNARIEKLEEEVNNTSDEVVELKAKLETSAGTVVSDPAQVEALETRIAALEVQIKALNEQKAELEAQVKAESESKAELVAQLKAVTEQQTSAEAHLQAATEQNTALQAKIKTLQEADQGSELKARMEQVIQQAAQAKPDLAKLNVQWREDQIRLMKTNTQRLVGAERLKLSAAEQACEARIKEARDSVAREKELRMKLLQTKVTALENKLNAKEKAEGTESTEAAPVVPVAPAAQSKGIPRLTSRPPQRPSIKRVLHGMPNPSAQKKAKPDK